MIKLTTDKEIINAIKFYEQAKSFNCALRNELDNKCTDPFEDSIVNRNKFHIGDKYGLLSSIFKSIKLLNKEGKL